MLAIMHQIVTGSCLIVAGGLAPVATSQPTEQTDLSPRAAADVGTTAPMDIPTVSAAAAMPLENARWTSKRGADADPHFDGAMAAALGNLVWDNGDPDGVNGLSHFFGQLGGVTHDRTIVDDFVLPLDTELTGATVCGIWVSGASAPGPVSSFRVRIWTDAGNQPAAGAPICERPNLGFDAYDVVFPSGMTAICYDVKFSNCAVNGGSRYWVSMQPAANNDNFLHLTSGTEPNIIGNQIYLWYLANSAPVHPQWTPGNTVFGAQHDVVFRLYAKDSVGACCLPKDNGDDPDPICIDSVNNVECAELDGIFHPNQICDDVFCPMQVECPKDQCCACVGDLNCDGVVNGADLLLLFGCWSACAPYADPICECADFNNSGCVGGGSALLEMLANWGTCPLAANDGGDIFNEDEPKCERLNDGCNIDPPAFNKIHCGDTVCGTVWTDTEILPPPHGHLPGTCQGFCGGQSPSGCWCDDQCFGFGDCCVDVCDWCSPPEVPECVYSDVLTRDTDWYVIHVKEKQRVVWQVHAEFPAQAIIAVRTPDCQQVHIIEQATAPPKIPFEISACLQPEKEYILFISPSVFEGLPCDKGPELQWGNAYVAEVLCQEPFDCPEKGACCVGEDCFSDQDEFSCMIKGGTFLPGEVCPDNPCKIPLGACCFKDGLCFDTTADECINTLEGTYRGNGTDCSDMVLIDIDCNGIEELVSICRSCHESSGEVWCNRQDICTHGAANDPFNGGCSNFPDEPAFEQICCGDSVGGEIWSIAGIGRDLDWRVLSIKEQSAVQLQIDHNFGNVGLNAILFIAHAGCPATIIHSAVVPTGGGLFTLLEPGKYYVIVTSEFVSGGPDLLCGSGNELYQLMVTCAPQNKDTCNGTCGFLFLPHGAYPTGFCSCDPDTCIWPFGSDDLSNPEHCCPGICDHCTSGICHPPICQNNPGAIFEGEPCSADMNGGCNISPNPNNFVFVQTGDQICGTVWAENGIRDTDWFRVTVGATGIVSGTVTAFDAPQVVFIVDADWANCTGIAVIGTIGWADGENAPGSQGTATATGLVPGSEVVVFTATGDSGGGAIYNGYPCDNEYLLDISAP